MKKNPVAYIRQLCSLGLGRRIIMPELLRALEAYIPSDFSAYSYADENYQLNNVYSTNTDVLTLLPLYLREFQNSKEVIALGSGFSDGMRYNRGWRNTAKLGRPFISSELFHEYCRPVGIQHGLQATIWELGRGWGSLSLHRGPGEKVFNDNDEKNLQALIPYIAHGVRGTRDLRGEMAPSGESGTLIIDSRNRISSYCPEGRRLMMLATHPAFGRAQLSDVTSPLISRLCENLRGILSGKPQPAPMLRQQNAWGEFIFRAYPLHDTHTPSGSIVVVIERGVPLAIKLMSNMSTSSLTARQREVCLLLSYGHSHSEIARRMNVTKHTATDYVRKIYDKLDVVGHRQLIQKLTTGSA